MGPGFTSPTHVYGEQFGNLDASAAPVVAGAQVRTSSESLECEPYANGNGWWHVPGCSHVDWEGDDKVRPGGEETAELP